MDDNSSHFRKNQEGLEEIKQIKNMFEGSITGIEPVIRENEVKDFKGSYSYIMQTFKPNHNIKLCIAYTLVNGLSDGWRINSINIAYECLRVFDGDFSKAFELSKLYYTNSYRKKTRTLRHLKDAFIWVMKHKDFKVSCNYLSANFPCIGSFEVCNKIRGMRIKEGGFRSMELLINQKGLYLMRLIDYVYYLRLNGKAMKVYLFLLQKYLETGFDTIYISYREIAKGRKTKYQNVARYLKELQKENLIAYKPGKAGLGSKTATEIKIIDITGREESGTEALFKKFLKN